MWIGQVMLYLAPTVLLCSRRRVTSVEGRAIALLLPAATFLVLFVTARANSGLEMNINTSEQFKAILSTHHLFSSNPNLPVSPYFPSLEIVTSSLSFLGHSSIYVSGISLMFAVHMLAAVGLFLLFFEITHSNRLSGLGLVIYALGPHYEFFDSYFIYQNIAVPFLILCLLAVVKAENAPRRSARRIWLAVGLAAAVITAISHHITSYALVGLLACFAVADLFPISVETGTTVPQFFWSFQSGSSLVGFWSGERHGCVFETGH